MKKTFTFLVLLLIIQNNFVRGQVNFLPFPIEGLYLTIPPQSRTYTEIVPIISPENSSNTVYISGNADVVFRSSKSITLNDGFYAGGFSNGSFQANIYEPGYDALIFPPNSDASHIGRFEKFEIGLSIPVAIDQLISDFLSEPGNSPFTEILNPYDPDHINIQATFQYNNGEVKPPVFGFYYCNYEFDGGVSWKDIGTYFQNENFNWRIRFSPDKLGKWNCKINIISPNNYFQPIEIADLNFICDHQDNGKKDYISVGPNKAFLYHNDSDEYEFLGGFNIMWPTYPHSALTYQSDWDMLQRIQNFHSWKMNFIGTVLLPKYDWISSGYINNADYGIEWERLNVYDTFADPLNREVYDNRQLTAWCLDNRFNYCEQNGIFQKISLLNCVEFSSNKADGETECYTWLRNPYRNHLNFSDRREFFTNTESQEIFKKRLRYIIARWGYSTSVAFWDIFYEAEMWRPGSHGQLSHDDLAAVYHWFDIMAAYIKEIDPNHLVTGAYAHPYPPSPNFFDDGDPRIADLVSLHLYDFRRYGNKMRMDAILNQKDEYRPVAITEAGADCGQDSVLHEPMLLDECTTIEIHKIIWGTAFMLNAGTLYWWWEKFDPPPINGPGFGYRQYRTVHEFFDLVDIKDHVEQYYYWDDGGEGSQSCQGTLDQKRLYEVFQLNFSNNENSLKYGYAWINNLSDYWYHYNTEYCWYYPPGTEDTDCYNTTTQDNDRKIKLQGLSYPMNYNIEFYYTGKEGNNWILEWDQTITENVLYGGYIEIHPAYYLSNLDGLGYFNDLACRIIPYSTLSSNIITYDTINCYLDTITTSGYYKDDLDHKFNYNWDFGDGRTSNLANPLIYYDNTGNYTIKLKIYNGDLFIDSLLILMTVNDCEINTDKMKNFQIDESSANNNTLSNTKFIENTALKIFPNPTTGILNIDFSQRQAVPYKLTIINAIGYEVLTLNNLNNLHNQLDLSNFPKGIYVLEIYYADEIKRMKIILK